MSENQGMKITIIFKKSSIFEGRTVTLRNITEIHYNYPFSTEKRVAFESDIHGTGDTHNVSDIEEFYTELETEKAESFCDLSTDELAQIGD